MLINVMNTEKIKAIEAQKERLQQELQYYESQIDEARTSVNKSVYFDEDSSDSESECLQIKSGLSMSDLKRREATLKTCLQATQELTCLEVLQSEVNIMVEDPKIDGEKPITEEGVWREVMAECCVDLVPFCVTFYTHRPNRTFAPQFYRGLRVVPMKKAHEVELAKSILSDMVRPSDAVEVIRSYAAAHRSRRTTLARLADSFAASLYMESMPEGGYKLKCANLMEVSWTLQNKWSHISPFHHRMKFDLEYMDESYIKTIKQAHRQLADPSIDTSERTQILSKIITTCLEAQGPTQELYESMSSDPETAKLEKRRTTLDKEPEMPVMRVKNDSEVMAPPKNLPKRVKSKNKAVKRDGGEMGGGKRMKIDEENKTNGNGVKNDAVGNTEQIKSKNESVASSTSSKAKRNNEEPNNVASVNIGKTAENKNKRKNDLNSVPSGGNVGKTAENKNKRKNDQLDGVASVNSGKSTENKKRKNENELQKNDGNTNVGKMVEKNKKSAKTKNTDMEIDNVASEKVIKNAKNAELDTETVKSKTVGKIVKKIAENSAGRNENMKSVAAIKNIVENGKVGEKNKPVADNVKVVKKITSNTKEKVQIKKIASNNVKNTGDNYIKNVPSEKNKKAENVPSEKSDKAKNIPTEKKDKAKNFPSEQNNKAKTIPSEKNDKAKNVPSEKKSAPNVKPKTLPKKLTEKDLKSVAPGQNKNTTTLPIKKVTNTETNTKDVPNMIKQAKPPNKALKTFNKPKMIAGNIKNKIGNHEKENNQDIGQKITKIPKKLPVYEELTKTNTLRVSPRHLVSKSKISPKFITNSMKTIKKPATSIPRLMVKPKPKIQ